VKVHGTFERRDYHLNNNIFHQKHFLAQISYDAKSFDSVDHLGCGCSADYGEDKDDGAEYTHG
jgi:hypothetical protein